MGDERRSDLELTPEESKIPTLVEHERALYLAGIHATKGDMYRLSILIDAGYSTVKRKIVIFGLQSERQKAHERGSK